VFERDAIIAAQEDVADPLKVLDDDRLVETVLGSQILQRFLTGATYEVAKSPGGSWMIAKATIEAISRVGMIPKTRRKI
jgi:hypothetical protein